MTYGGEGGVSEWSCNLEVLQRFQNNINNLDEALLMEDLDLAFKYLENIYIPINTKIRRQEKYKDEKEITEKKYKKLHDLQQKYKSHSALFLPFKDGIRELQSDIQYSAEMRDMMNRDKERDVGL